MLSGESGDIRHPPGDNPVPGVDVRPLLRLSLFVREVENIGFVLSRFGRVPEPNDAGIGIVQPGF